MTAAVQTLTSSLASDEVLAFADQQGIATYLPGLYEMTSRLFPSRSILLYVEEDPEISNDRHIILEVDATGMNAQQMFDAQQRWHGECFEHCPAIHVCNFRLGMTERS